MVDEEKYEYGCKIFCIYFGKDNEGEAKDTLEKIAKEGKTDMQLYSDSLTSLCEKFQKISGYIEKNYKLGLNMSH